MLGPCGRSPCLLVLVIAAMLATMPGCGYLSNRSRDAAEMFDVGCTFSKKPQLGLYMNCPMILPIGYGHVDGYYAGVAAGRVGAMKHTQRNAGLLLWGRENNTWADGGDGGGEEVEDQQVGVLGLAAERKSDVPYKPSCKHYFHLGWFGVTANVRWPEIPDFLLGWVGLDISRDDKPAPSAAPRPPAKGEAPPQDGASDSQRPPQPRSD